MKLAIYGDSFGTGCWKTPNNPIPESWFLLLEDMIGSKIDNRAEPAKSVYSCYRDFLDSHQNYDKIIFLVTDPNIYYKDVELGDDVPLKRMVSTKMIDMVHRRYSLSEQAKTTLNYLSGWYNSSDSAYNEMMAEFMISDMERIRDDVIFYPSFANSFTEYRYSHSGVQPGYSFNDLIVKQIVLMGLDERYGHPDSGIAVRERPETMSAHLGPEFNACFAELMYNKIKNGVFDYTNFVNIKLTHPKEYYYDLD